MSEEREDYRVEEQYEESLPAPRLEETGDYSENVKILTCADLKRMGIIESEEDEESGGVACCPTCVAGKHQGEEENFPHVVTTPKGTRVDFCCMCYDYVPVSALVGNEASNAWIDEALEKQIRVEFPHFQEVGGKKRVTIFALELRLEDMRHTIGVQFADLKTSLNAHDALKLLELLDSHRAEITALSQQLDAAAWSEDQADMQRIAKEWHDHRHEGDETGL